MPTNNEEVNFTIRSTVVGLLIGSVMCFSNMYFGLQTGWISMMSLQASLLGFAIFRHVFDFGPKENVYLQTVAVATATMPLAAGFVGVIPALHQLTTSDHPSGPIELSAWRLVLWSLGLSFIGVLFAVPLRKQTIVREQLKFPSGTATAQMIQVLHQKNRRQDVEMEALDSPSEEGESGNMWHLKQHALVYSFMISSVYTIASYFFPMIYSLPIFNWISLNLIDFKSWEWYFTPSLSYIGQGIIMGLPTTLSMLLGCVIGWGILSPLAYYTGWAPGPVSDWKTGSRGWILWVSLGIMISESIISLFIVLIKQCIALYRTYKQNHMYFAEDSHVQESLLNDEDRDDIEEETQKTENLPQNEQVPSWMMVGGLIASIVLCILTIQIVFGRDIMPVGITCIAILLALFLSILGVRALGETDLNPVSGIGKISQFIFAALMPNAIVANLIAGAIAEAGAQQAGDLMQDLKTGFLLQASPKAQFYGQVIGSFVSAFVATGAYLLYSTIYTIPSEEFSVPTAQVWLDMARLVNGQPLPPHVFEFIVAFSVLFGILVILKETCGEKKWSVWIPQGIAFAIGMYNPPNFTLARVIGGCMYSLWETYNSSFDPDNKWHRILDSLFQPYRNLGMVSIIIVASGFVLGEGTCSIINMIMHALHIPRLES